MELDFLSMVDTLLSGLTPFQKLFETISQTAIKDRDTLPVSSLANKFIWKTIRGFDDKEFEISLLKRDLSAPIHAVRTEILLKVN